MYILTKIQLDKFVKNDALVIFLIPKAHEMAVIGLHKITWNTPEDFKSSTLM